MKEMTIWQRLNTALLLLIVLLLAGVGLALWVEKTRAGVQHRNDQLALASQRLELHLLVLNESLRGMLLEPKNEVDPKRRRQAQKEISDTLDSIQAAFSVPLLQASVPKARPTKPL